MQAVLAIPGFAARVSEQEATELLMRPVAGIPLLIRTVLLALRAGANDILLIWPADCRPLFLRDAATLSGRARGARQNGAA